MSVQSHVWAYSSSGSSRHFMQIGLFFVKNTFCTYGSSWRKCSQLAVMCFPLEAQNQQMISGSISSGSSCLSAPSLVSVLFSGCVGVWGENCCGSVDAA